MPQRANSASYRASGPASELVWLMAVCAPSAEEPAFSATKGTPWRKALIATRENAATSSRPSMCMPITLTRGSDNRHSTRLSMLLPALLPTVSR